MVWTYAFDRFGSFAFRTPDEREPLTG